MITRLVLSLSLTGCVLSKDTYEQRRRELTEAIPAPTLVDCFTDLDGDGFGTEPAIQAASCGAGTSSRAGDCNDGDAAIQPDATEVCGNDVDEDCDGTAAEGVHGYRDNDGDGIGAGDPIAACTLGDLVPLGTDCDDTNAGITPGANETPGDGIDSDCDGEELCYVDDDRDGRGSPQTVAGTLLCDGEGTSALGDDCDDVDPNTNPVADERCAPGDQNCDGDDSLGAVDPTSWFADLDEDGFGDAAAVVVQCDAPQLYVADSTDCNDADPAIFPGATERCNDVDDDCNGPVDDVLPAGLPNLFQDADGDGYGGLQVASISCDTTGYATVGGDCDDDQYAVNPAAPELCNGIDDDCDGMVDADDADLADGVEIYRDQDADGWGGGPLLYIGCYPLPPDTSDENADCDDEDASINPEALEFCDGVDQNCDGISDAGIVSDANFVFASLQAAVDVGSSGDLVQVCGGPGPAGVHPLEAFYPETFHARGVEVEGIRPTIIPANPAARIVENDNGITLESVDIDGMGAADSSGCIAIHDGALTLIDVQMRNCRGPDGAAVLIDGPSSLVASSSTFEANEALGSGGAVYCDGCESVSISDSTFLNNHAETGGAIHLLAPTDASTFDSVDFTGNEAGSSGGALNASMSILTLVGGTFSDNAADLGGGMLSLLNDATIRDVVFDGNNAAVGSAIELLSGDLLVSATTITNHTNLGGAITLGVAAGTLQVGQSQFSNNAIGVAVDAGVLESTNTSWVDSPISLGQGMNFDPGVQDFVCDPSSCLPSP